MKIMPNKIVTSILFMLIILGVNGKYALASDQQLKCVFLDGTVQDVENTKFVYTWFYESEKKYLNHPLYKTKSDDFHYLDRVNGVSLDWEIPGNTIKKIELAWKKNYSWYEPTAITVTLKAGKKIIIPNSVNNKMNVASTFLQNIPLEAVKDESNFVELVIEGIATIENQQGKFSGSITDSTNSNGLHTDKLIKEIIFP